MEQFMSKQKFFDSESAELVKTEISILKSKENLKSKKKSPEILTQKKEIYTPLNFDDNISKIFPNISQKIISLNMNLVNGFKDILEKVKKHFFKNTNANIKFYYKDEKNVEHELPNKDNNELWKAFKLTVKSLEARIE
jgi:hypothetical protein